MLSVGRDDQLFRFSLGLCVDVERRSRIGSLLIGICNVSTLEHDASRACKYKLANVAGYRSIDYIACAFYVDPVIQ